MIIKQTFLLLTYKSNSKKEKERETQIDLE